MKILFIGDIHGELNALCRALSFAEGQEPEPDVVVLSGDLGSPILGDNAHRTDRTDGYYRLSTEAVLRAAAQFSQPVMFVPGNRDLPDQDSPHGVHNIDLLSGQQPFNVEGFTFFGIGGSNFIQGGWPYEWKENRVTDCAGDILSGDEKAHSSTVLLTHDAPADTLLDRHESSGQSIGSTAIRRLIDDFQPRLLLCGHVHEGVGLDVLGSTLCVNAGSLVFADEQSLVVSL